MSPYGVKLLLNTPKTTRELVQEAGTGLGLKDGALFAYGVDEILLSRPTLGEALIERCVMRVSSACEFDDQSFVTLIESPLLPHPAQRFRMLRIPTFTLVLGENIPEPVELAMLSEQMLPTQMLWMNVPDAHIYLLRYVMVNWSTVAKATQRRYGVLA